MTVYVNMRSDFLRCIRMNFVDTHVKQTRHRFQLFRAADPPAGGAVVPLPQCFGRLHWENEMNFSLCIKKLETPTGSVSLRCICVFMYFSCLCMKHVLRG